MKSNPKFETLAIKSVGNDYFCSRPVSTPIYLSSTFERNVDGSYEQDLVYSRNSNPNRNILEKSMAQLEQGKHAFAFSSGMSAINAVFQCLSTGDHILLPNDIYYAIKKLMDQVMKRWGLSYDLVDMSNLLTIEENIKKNTRLIWVESPSNPLLKISDISAIVKIANKHHLLCAVDNTWATPVFQNPLSFGADIAMHSSTKYLGGHSDVVGGCIVVNDEKLAEKLRAIQTLSGAVPSPFDAWLITRGIQTLSLRISKQSDNAFKLAQFLNDHANIEKVHYPGLSSHPNHDIAKKQQSNGYGAMISVLVKGNSQQAMNISNRLKYFTTATSLGGVESLVEHRKSVEGPESKTPENLLRISVGIEHIDDLIQDWDQALKN